MSPTNTLSAGEKRKYWSGVIERFESSQQTRKVFCQEHGLDYDQFQYWYGKQRRAQNSDVSKLLPIEVTSIEDKAPTIHCIVELPQGARLLVHDLTSLKTLVRVLQSCS